MSALSYRTETVIRRPPQDVFAHCSDLRSELQWNPKANYVEKLTDGPVRVGTRYEHGGPTADPPPSRSSSSIAPEAGRPRPRHEA